MSVRIHRPYTGVGFVGGGEVPKVTRCIDKVSGMTLSVSTLVCELIHVGLPYSKGGTEEVEGLLLYVNVSGSQFVRTSCTRSRPVKELTLAGVILAPVTETITIN